MGSQDLTLANVLLAIQDLKLKIESQYQSPSSDWISRDSVKVFFGYKDTQLTSLEKKESLVVSKIGKRKFYSRESILNLLNRNIQTPK